MAEDVIWIVVNAEDTQGKANEINAQGARELAAARIAAGADMLYTELCAQAAQLKTGDRIVMYQGGARGLGGQLLVACGRVSAPVVPLTQAHVGNFLPLWQATVKWYRRFPATPEAINGERIIFYNLKKFYPPEPSPQEIRPRQGNKFLDLHPNCTLHKRCTVYKQIDTLWCQHCER